MTAPTAAGPGPNGLLDAAPSDPGERVARLRVETGELIGLDVQRRHAEPSEGELGVSGRPVGPVLDIGCGPGRLLVALGGLSITAVA